MSYGRDPDGQHRGVGAIAAIDGAGSRRRVLQARKQRVMQVIDARNARLALGPGRALPVSMRSMRGLRGLGAINQQGGQNEGGGGGGATLLKPSSLTTNLATITQVATAPTPTTGTTRSGASLLSTVSAVLPQPRPTYDPSGSGSGSGSSSGSSSSSSTTVVTTPPTTVKPPVVIGGGGGSWSPPPLQVPTFTPPSETPELGPPSGDSLLTPKNLLIAGAGIGLLYLLTRKHQD